MDNSGSGKKLGKPKPFMNFPPTKPTNRFEPFLPMQRNLPVSDDLQPGTLPSQGFLGHFSPYAPNTQPNSIPFQTATSSPSPEFLLTPDSGNMSTSSSSTSLSTREHFIRTYSQESVGKLKIEPNTEVRYLVQ